MKGPMLKKIKIISACILTFMLAGGLWGCGHSIKVIPTPTDSDVYLDGNVVGHSVTTVSLKDKHQNYKVNVCGPEGYFCKSTMVNFQSAKSISVHAPKDHSYFETVPSNDIANKWITIKVAKQYGEQESWRKLTSSISHTIADFEVLDQKSLYLKSAWKMAGKRDDYLRTCSRIIVSVGNPDPNELTYRIKIESVRKNRQGEIIEETNRTFKSFLDALETSRARLLR